MISSGERSTNWPQLGSQVLDGRPLSFEQALAVVRAPDEELLDLLSAAYRVRRHHFGKRVQLYFLMNAKSGICPEDCGYCSQSKSATSDVPKYNILSRDKLLAGAQAASERDAKTYCIVISARSPNEREMEAVISIVPEIKAKYDLNICALFRTANRRPGSPAQGLRSRPSQPQRQYEFQLLREDLFDSLVRGPNPHPTIGARRGNGNLQWRHYRNGRVGRRRRANGDGARPDQGGVHSR